MTFAPKPQLDAALSTPMYQQLYMYLRKGILSGQLPGGTKLPSTRALAEQLGVSRNTVLNAYDQLLAEGYLQSTMGKGTFVTDKLPDTLLRAPSTSQTRQIDRPPTRTHRISSQAQHLLERPTMPTPVMYRAFQSGVPALDQFPYDLWARLISRHANQLYPDKLGYQETMGYKPLREAIANHVILSRQVHCTPEQVILVTGSQEGVYLAARTLLNVGDDVWIEDPGYLGARNALIAAGGRINPMPVDEQGLCVSKAIAQVPQARLAYVTPSHQFPLGISLSLERRLTLLEWAKHNDAYILEDDYDSEFHFDTRPLASLQGLDQNESVIYIGTFSKALFPALRIGYVIVPPPLVEAFTTMRAAMNYHLPFLEQAALTDFISEGHFLKHLRRMRTLYAHRQSVLLDAARDLPLTLTKPSGGMQVIGWLPEGVDDKHISQEAGKHHVRVTPVSIFGLNQQRRGLILGYAGYNEDEIERGVQRLSAALKRLI